MSRGGKTKIAVFGASGRMGLELIKLIAKESSLELCAAVDSGGPASHQRLTKFEDLKKADPHVVIDFSSPEGTEQISQWCGQNKIPLVTGTTGLKSSQEQALKEAAKKTAIFKSSNMGLGINAMAAMFGEFLKKFPATEVEIEETHHRFKKDRPSGTALFLKEEVKLALPHGSKTKVGEPTSLRGGEIFGIHKVYFFSDGEWVCFEHQATDRSVFARGALKAAQWITGKKPGFYSMKNMLFEGS